MWVRVPPLAPRVRMITLQIRTLLRNSNTTDELMEGLNRIGTIPIQHLYGEDIILMIESYWIKEPGSLERVQIGDKVEHILRLKL